MTHNNQLRPYQEKAVKEIIEALKKGKVTLDLPVGAGKTLIAPRKCKVIRPKRFNISVKRTYEIYVEFPEGSRDDMQNMIMSDLSHYADEFTNDSLQEMVADGYLEEVNGDQWESEEELQQLIQLAKDSKIIFKKHIDYDAHTEVLS